MTRVTVARRVLVVDDESLTREVVAVVIESGDVSVLEAATGAQALDLAREQRPDLVLLDVMMPGMDGFEVCRQLKADPETSGIRVVMLTALADAASRRAAASAGADGYLVKPFSAREIFAVLDGGGE